MKKFIQNCLLMILTGSGLAMASTDEATIVQFSEREEGIGAYPVRYIIAKNMLRIDDDNDASDYVLYDDKKRIIYSVNHGDQTILVINHNDWKLPAFDFQRNVTWKALESAPAINDKKVFSYWLSAGKTICSEAQVVEGFLSNESALLKRYKQTLSGEQVTSLVATPEDMRTPCLLVDQVYNMGSVYDKGFPIQQWHVNGLQRIMLSYKKAEKVSSKLFDLPTDYKSYSIGDNLRFGNGDSMPPANGNSPAHSQSH